MPFEFYLSEELLQKWCNQLNIEKYIMKKEGQQNLTHTGHFNDKRNMGIENE